MILHMYTVLDSVACAFLQPFYAVNDNVAKRSFADAARDPAHVFALQPADYTLYAVGSFDDTTGILTAYDSPNRVCSALELKPSPSA